MPLRRDADQTDHPELKEGDFGDAVARLQRLLCEQYEQLRQDRFVTGRFDHQTEKWLRLFQNEDGLPTNGRADDRTWLALERDRTRPREDCREAYSELGARLFDTLEQLGHDILDDGRGYHLNLIGIRHPGSAVNLFADRLAVIYADENRHRHTLLFPVSTGPGCVLSSGQTARQRRVSVLAPGQYHDAYALERRRNGEAVFSQKAGEVAVWRGCESDCSETPERGYFGVDIHANRSGAWTAAFARQTASCQVFQNAADFAALVQLAGKSRSIRGNRFSYTLIHADMLKRD